MYVWLALLALLWLCDIGSEGVSEGGWEEEGGGGG